MGGVPGVEHVHQCVGVHLSAGRHVRRPAVVHDPEGHGRGRRHRGCGDVPGLHGVLVDPGLPQRQPGHSQADVGHRGPDHGHVIHHPVVLPARDGRAVPPRFGDHRQRHSDRSDDDCTGVGHHDPGQCARRVGDGQQQPGRRSLQRRRHRAQAEADRRTARDHRVADRGVRLDHDAQRDAGRDADVTDPQVGGRGAVLWCRHAAGRHPGDQTRRASAHHGRPRAGHHRLLVRRAGQPDRRQGVVGGRTDQRHRRLTHARWGDHPGRRGHRPPGRGLPGGRQGAARPHPQGDAGGGQAVGCRGPRQGCAAKMPHRGGLSGRIAAARAGVSPTASTRSTAVAIRLGTREKYDLRSMDLGRLRHPTYGHRPWVSQTVPAGAFTEPFQDGSSDVRNRVSAEVARLLDEIAREASN